MDGRGFEYLQGQVEAQQRVLKALVIALTQRQDLIPANVIEYFEAMKDAVVPAAPQEFRMAFNATLDDLEQVIRDASASLQNPESQE